MLIHHFNRPGRNSRQHQQGMVLLVALIVLVAMTIAGIALVRSVDTATLVAGNLAFQQAATRASDKGVEAAIAVIKEKRISNALDTDDNTNGYFATLRSADDTPPVAQGWQAFWQGRYCAGCSSPAYAMDVDQFGYRVFFVIHRQCGVGGVPYTSSQCVASPVSTRPQGNGEDAGDIGLETSSLAYYRITVRVSGPKRTESYVQTNVSM